MPNKFWPATRDNAVLALAAAEDAGLPSEVIRSSEGGFLYVGMQFPDADMKKKMEELESTIDEDINGTRKPPANPVKPNGEKK